MRGIGLLVVCSALVGGCGSNGPGPLVCGTLTGAVSANVINCTHAPATYDPVAGSTQLTLLAGGTAPVAGDVKVSVTFNGKPIEGTYHDGDSALRFAQVLFKTADGSEYDADWAGPTGNGVGHLTVSVASVDAVGANYTVHGTIDALTLQDSVGPVAIAHVEF